MVTVIVLPPPSPGERRCCADINLESGSFVCCFGVGVVQAPLGRRLTTKVQPPLCRSKRQSRQVKLFVVGGPAAGRKLRLDCVNVDAIPLSLQPPHCRQRNSSAALHRCGVVARVHARVLERWHLHEAERERVSTQHSRARSWPCPRSPRQQ